MTTRKLLVACLATTGAPNAVVAFLTPNSAHRGPVVYRRSTIDNNSNEIDYSSGATGSSSSTTGNTGGNEWSVADDWESMSAENPINSAPDSATIFNQDIGFNAAKSILSDNHGEDFVVTEEDIWLDEVIEEIVQNPVSVTPLYDTKILDEESGTTGTKKAASKTKEDEQKDFEEHMGEEIAMLVRCNESPADMLVQTGRAVANLTVAQKQDVLQLVAWNEDDRKEGQWEPTPFFQQAVATIFNEHAPMSVGAAKGGSDKSSEPAIMDAKAISSWMMKSLGNELESYTERQANGKDMVVTRAKKVIRIGRHDSRVLKAISSYSVYGTGKVKLEGFQQLYLDALLLTQRGNKVKEDCAELLTITNAEHIRQIWRDFNNHGVVGPTEQQWRQDKAKLEAEFGSLEAQMKQSSSISTGGLFVDECEILDFTYEAQPSSEEIEAGYDSKNNKYIRKSSHEQVQLAKDGKTPLYMNEGDFVFIDEESCIGCMQCVNAAPSSFLMLEDGRARTFHQRQGADVKQGVAACPVSCMHFVSYDELEELETGRDKGDGRDDHKHMGHKRGHTPLFVAGIDSDANHRSSWYHHLKNQCDNTGQCPQRGCYDCPSYRLPGGNPYFQKKAKAGQHTRAQQFIEQGDADLWRKTAEL